MTDLLNLHAAKALALEQHELMITNLNRVERMSDEDPGSTCTEERNRSLERLHIEQYIVFTRAVNLWVDSESIRFKNHFCKFRTIQFDLIHN